MAKIKEGRWTAEVEGEFVVFLIGMRINRLWKVWKWLPVFMAMPKMLIELFGKPELGLMHARTHFGLRNTMLVQYWRSYDQLYAYATDRTLAHLPAWKAFNQQVAKNGDVGIWHETYTVRPGDFRNIYGNMPAYGLGLAGRLKPAGGKH
ncbi:DUF4188 domain-containing protein [Hyphomonas sp.]|uniref:DUF4188 domain-containing protein n=1 Tax=Hyphomonas sp. TaxID=87 RepID=UPI00391A764E